MRLVLPFLLAIFFYKHFCERTRLHLTLYYVVFNRLHKRGGSRFDCILFVSFMYVSLILILIFEQF